MIRSYALTFAAVTLRLQIPLSQIAGLSMETAYPVIAWLSWIPNLLLAECLFDLDMDFCRRTNEATLQSFKSE